MSEPSTAQIRAHEAYMANGQNAPKTAKALGMALGALKKNLFSGHLNGLTIPTEYCKHLPIGLELSAASIHVSKDGQTSGWYKGTAFKQTQEELFTYLKKRVPTSDVKLKPVVDCDPEIQLEITLADLHFGMLAWNAETGGGDYDINIARQLVTESMIDIFSTTGNVEETVLVLMGDNFHTDFFSAKTEGHGHSLDVDSRYPKMIFTGAETFLTAIEICKRFSKRVKVIVLYGNHDIQTSVNLQALLYFHYLDRPGCEDITVDVSPSKHRYNIWGISATEYTHGNGTNKFRLSSDIVQHIATHDITGVREFYAKQAHLHKEHVEDINGVTFEIVPSPVAKDAYAAGAHYSSKRAIIATEYHKRFGYLERHRITPRKLAAMKEKL